MSWWDRRILHALKIHMRGIIIFFLRHPPLVQWSQRSEMIRPDYSIGEDFIWRVPRQQSGKPRDC
ncbi:hypothetical protein TSUD_41590 [Trifolium subterraneum]|nr:hypothetical protein TSUD_41590 [Trifolium subterraneum]